MGYRHEWKHEINVSDLITLRQRLRAVARSDPNTIDGEYKIRSLYFDNLNDKALREKLDGVNLRAKYRIRCYNGDLSYIRLEKKSKINGLESKFLEPVTKEEVENLLNGQYEWMLDPARPLCGELYSRMMSQGLRPKVIVDYTREPFIYGPGNVRVTFDYNIRTGLRCVDFLNNDCITIPAAESPIILEVKWDEFLPDIIRDAVQLGDRHVRAYSKYADCRMYD